MPYRHQGAPGDAPDATAKHCAIAPIFRNVLLWRPRCVEWNEFKFDVKWGSHQVDHEGRDATFSWRHWADQHDDGFASRIHSFWSDRLDPGYAATTILLADGSKPYHAPRRLGWRQTTTVVTAFEVAAGSATLQPPGHIFPKSPAKSRRISHALRGSGFPG